MANDKSVRIVLKLSTNLMLLFTFELNTSTTTRGTSVKYQRKLINGAGHIWRFKDCTWPVSDLSAYPEPISKRVALQLLAVILT
jgi:hypothetical protein